jgi:exodeoxyribonuclease-3
MRLISWNVNGIRAIAKKGFAEIVKNLDTDIICLQETKAQVDQVNEVLLDYGYYVYANQAVKKGYSGTAILSKKEPLDVVYDMGIEEHDKEGRVIAAEFENFFVVTAYVPNSKAGLLRLDYRKKWDADLLKYLKKLESNKPVIFCGDLNVAHRDIDIARAKANYNVSPGYTQTEIDGLDNYIESGLADSFRLFHPEEVKYSWWSFRAGARTRNVGWRLDYFLISEKLIPQVKEADILTDEMGSDHAPILLVLERL